MKSPKSFLFLLKIHNNFIKALTSGYLLIGVIALVQYMLVPMYVEKLGMESFGFLTLIMSVMSFASIGITWVSGGISRIMCEYSALSHLQKLRKCYILGKWNYCLYALIIVAVFWLGVIILCPQIYIDQEKMITLLLASVNFIILYEYNIDRIAFFAIKKQSRGDFHELLGQITFFCLAKLSLHYISCISIVVASQIVGNALVRFLSYQYWRSHPCHFKWGSVDCEVKKIWYRLRGKMGKNYMIYGMLLLIVEADPLILGWVVDTNVIAQYYLIWRLPQLVTIIIFRIPNVYGVHLVALDVQRNYQRLVRNYKIGLVSVGLIALVLSVIYALYGEWMLEIWVGKKVTHDLHAYLYASLAMFFISLSSWPRTISFFLQKVLIINYILLLEAILKIVCIVLLADQYGYFAPFIAVCVIYTSGLAIAYLAAGFQALKQTQSRQNVAPPTMEVVC